MRSPKRNILLLCLAFVALVALATCARGGDGNGEGDDGDEAPVGSTSAALQCGCDAVGAYQPPALVAPRQAAAPGDAFRVETSTVGQSLEVRVFRTSDDVLIYSAEALNNNVVRGFDPSGNRLVYSFTDVGATTRTVRAVNLLVSPPVEAQTSVAVANAAVDLGFSPHGTYLAFAAPKPGATPTLALAVADLRRGAQAFAGAFVRSFGAALPTDPALDTVNDASWGFSPDDDSFTFARRTANQKPISLALVNLVKGEQLALNLETEFPANSTWAFSPCGDTLGLAQPLPFPAGSKKGSIFETSGGLEKTFKVQTALQNPTFRSTPPVPGAPSQPAVLSEHQVLFGGSASAKINNQAALACPSAFPTIVEVDLLSIVGGNSMPGKITLSGAAPAGGLVIKLASTSSAATVPATVTVPGGATSATFTVNTTAVLASTNVTLHATLGTIDQTVTFQITPATPRPLATLTTASNAVKGGTSLSGKFTLVGAAGATTVTLQVDNAVASLPNTSFTLPGGVDTQNFEILTAPVLVTTPVTLTASSDGGPPISVTFNVTVDVQPPQLIPCSGQTLAPNDDGSAPPFAMPFGLNFFGAQTQLLHINNNGNVTFEGPLPTFTPFAITANTRPIIAPFFADVDTRGAGSNLMTYGQTVFQGRNAVCVSWLDVGYFAAHDDKLNSFQLLLVDRSPDFVAGDFDIVMNYNQVAWETGDASQGANGFGGISAGAGYSAGTGVPGEFFEFPGSRVPGSLLDTDLTTGLTNTRRNSLALGRHVFEVRNGSAPVGVSVRGVVNANGSQALADATVQVCRTSDGRCVFFTLTTPDGRYMATSIAPGDYVVSAYPPAGSLLLPATSSLVHVDGSSNLVVDLNLAGPTPLPPGTSIGPTHSSPGGVPIVHWTEPLTLRTQGCEGGVALFRVTQGAATLAAGPMAEAPPGTFTGAIAPLAPHHGEARVSIAIDCPAGKPDESAAFSIYIDPSGTVVTPEGNPVPGAVVTLLRSDSPSGPFEAVPDGSAIMSPTNRTNPDRSDAQGHYGWDVIAGYYVVRAQKEGCRALNGNAFYESPVLTIGPPVTDLDLVLDCPDVDLTPPSIDLTLSAPPSAGGVHKGPVDVTLNATDAGFGVVGVFFELTGAETGSGFVSGENVTFVVRAEGETTVTYWAVDAAGNEGPHQTLVIRIDTIAPTIQCSVNPSELWVQDHRLVSVKAKVTTGGATSFTLVSVTSNEADSGLGNGDVPNDIQGFAFGTPDLTGKVRSERSQAGSGREYSLLYEAVDLAGNAARCTAVVRVPR